jgi:hypothetical protein
MQETKTAKFNKLSVTTTWESGQLQSVELLFGKKKLVLTSQEAYELAAWLPGSQSSQSVQGSQGSPGTTRLANGSVNLPSQPTFEQLARSRIPNLESFAPGAPKSNRVITGVQLPSKPSPSTLLPPSDLEGKGLND